MSETTERLDQIEARAKDATYSWAHELREDRDYLIALARKQAAALEAVRELHAEDLFRGHLSNGCKTCGNGEDGYPCPTIRALEGNL